VTIKKFNWQFHARLQESRREAEDGVGDFHLLEGYAIGLPVIQCAGYE